MRELLEKIFEKIKRHPGDILGYEDLYHMCLSNIGEDNNLAIEYLKKLSDTIEEVMPKLDDIELLQKLFGLHKKVLLGAAPYDFESYILYIEWDREPDKKFYPPRRKVLRQVVNSLQELADDKLDLLAVSLPPGAGKSTLAIFFLTWLAGKRPNEPKLTGSHSNAFIRGVYDECLRILETNGEYLWHDVFPMVNVSSTNAKDCRIDVDKRQRF